MSVSQPNAKSVGGRKKLAGIRRKKLKIFMLFKVGVSKSKSFFVDEFNTRVTLH